MGDYEGSHHKTNQFPPHLLSIDNIYPIVPLFSNIENEKLFCKAHHKEEDFYAVIG